MSISLNVLVNNISFWTFWQCYKLLFGWSLPFGVLRFCKGALVIYFHFFRFHICDNLLKRVLWWLLLFIKSIYYILRLSTHQQLKILFFFLKQLLTIRFAVHRLGQDIHYNPETVQWKSSHAGVGATQPSWRELRHSQIAIITGK